MGTHRGSGSVYGAAICCCYSGLRTAATDRIQICFCRQASRKSADLQAAGCWLGRHRLTFDR